MTEQLETLAAATDAARKEMAKERGRFNVNDGYAIVRKVAMDFAIRVGKSDQTSEEIVARAEKIFQFLILPGPEVK